MLKRNIYEIFNCLLSCTLYNIRWEKVRGVFPVTSNGKNATNFFPHTFLIYLSFINSSSKNSLIEVEFYQKKIIISISFQKRKSRKIIRKEMRIFETCEENMRKKIE